MTAAQTVINRYLEVNGNHAMTEADDAYCLRYFAPVPDEGDYSRKDIFRQMSTGQLPLPSYLLSTGEPMVHRDYLDPVRRAGSPEALEKWFLAQWPASAQETARQEWKGYLSGQNVCLYSVTPANLQAKARLIDTIRALVAQPLTAASRSRLAKVVDALDALEPPFTDYDRHRFNAPTSRQVWIDDIRAR